LQNSPGQPPKGHKWETKPDQPDRKGQVTGQTGSQTGDRETGQAGRARQPLPPLTTHAPAQVRTLPFVTKVFSSPPF
jgi:hypothetical protein